MLNKTVLLQPTFSSISDQKWEVNLIKYERLKTEV